MVSNAGAKKKKFTALCCLPSDLLLLFLPRVVHPGWCGMQSIEWGRGLEGGRWAGNAEAWDEAGWRVHGGGGNGKFESGVWAGREVNRARPPLASPLRPLAPHPAGWQGLRRGGVLDSFEYWCLGPWETELGPGPLLPTYVMRREQTFLFSPFDKRKLVG